MGYLAARLDDAHSCPAHGGDRIFPGCAPTILIEGMAAARKGDGIACVGGQKGVIDQGEATVLLEGKPAAYLGAGTSHGGRILLACANTYVGQVPGGPGSKADRVRIRQELINAAYARARSMPPGEERDRLLAAVDRLKRNNVAVEHMRLCDNSYYPERAAPEGWKKLECPELDPDTGFYAQVYQSEIDGSIVVVFRGTDIWEGDRSGEKWTDIWNGNVQNVGIPARQYQHAIEYARQMHAIYGDKVTFAGDSLGGGLATVAALATGAPASTFNAAGVHPNTLLLHRLNPFATGNIDAYQVQGDLLSTAQQASGLPFPLNLLRLPLLQGLPDALGDRHVLPAYDGANPRGWPDRQGNLKDQAGAILNEMLQRHYPQAVIDSLEAQKAADIATIQGLLP